MEIKKILDKIGNFSEYETSFFEEHVIQKDFKKGELILQQGETCRSLYFVIDGAFLQYNFASELNQNIVDLHYKFDWMSNHQSLISQLPSSTIIEAYTDSKVIELSLDAIHSMIGRFPVFLQLGKLLEQTKIRSHFYDLSLTPIEKYQYLLEYRHELFQYFPLKIIASYLKITPETLSRVREKLAKGIS